MRSDWVRSEWMCTVNEEVEGMESGDLQIVIQNADTEIVGYHTAGFGSALFFKESTTICSDA